jgi:hypothetical protein
MLPPEMPLIEIAEGDFSRMQRPLLVAADLEKDVRLFCRRAGLSRRIVKRVMNEGDLRGWPRGKVMILLPRWHVKPENEGLVGEWVRHEGYTTELSEDYLGW